MDRLWRTKSILTLQNEAKTDQSLKRSLGLVNLTALGIGAIIGAGIFVLTGQAAAEYAGPGVIFSFALAAVACCFAGICYAEFASMIPIAGSAYTYSYATLGEFFAWFIGWDLILEYAVCAATVAVGWSGYMVSLLRMCGIQIPPELMAAPGTEFVFLPTAALHSLHLTIPEGWYQLSSYAKDLVQAGIPVASLQHGTAVFNLPAFVIVALLTALLVRGVKESAVVNTLIVILKVAVVLLVIGVGFVFVNPNNWFPLIPQNSGEFGHFGMSGVVRAAGVVFFAYIGFDAVSTTAQEARNPQRDMPLGILGSLAICTVLYILMALVLTGLVSYTKLNVADPVAVAIDVIGIPWLSVLVKLGALAGLSSVVLVFMMGQPRIFYSMAKDGLLPPFFHATHSRYHTPHKTTLLTGAFVAVVAAMFPISILGELVSIGTLSAFIVVCAGVLVLRYKQPNLPRPFKAPFMPVTAILGIVCCLYLAVSLPPDTWIRLIVWLAIGMTIYFTYGIRKSRISEGVSPGVVVQPSLARK